MEHSEFEGSFEAIQDAIRQFSPCMNDYLYVFDIPSDTYYISKRAKERFLLPSHKFHDVINAHRQFVHPDDVELLTSDLTKMTSGEKQYHNLHYRWLGKDGQPIWVNCRGQLLSRDGRPSCIIGCINEIGARQAADNITGLLGEASFRRQLEHFHGNFPEGFLLRIGIDDFKDINEKFGVEYGDFVLRTVAECIAASLQSGEQAYRMLSDEFIIFDSCGRSAGDAEALYIRICAAIEAHIEARSYEAVYTISGGIITQRDIRKPGYSEIMKISQFALSEAKSRGKNQFYTFRDADYEKFLRKRKILRALRESVANDFSGFELYFQPIMYAGTGRLFAAEALLRFRLPGQEAVSPAEFVPILEESGLIIPVGKWILRTALSMCQECQKLCPDFKISINLSYIQILKSTILSEIVNNISTTAVLPDSVIMELTESGHLENTPSIQNVWNQLREFGVNIAIDDFGTGYSNLQNIGSLMPNIVKIDRGFTLKALQNTYEYQLMIHIIEMVHSLGLRVCVEGIETEAELEKISRLNPDYIQGYYYSKPCPRGEFLARFMPPAA